MLNKILIIAIWCMVPVCAMLFLAADYRHFGVETALQEERCEALRTHVSSYARQYEMQLRTIQQISSTGQRDLWRAKWRRLKAQQQTDLNALGNASLSRYPQAAAALSDAQVKLAELAAQIETAAQKQDTYMKSGNGIGDMQAQIDYLQDLSSMYRNIWTYGIYLDIQERLGQMEDDLNERREIRMSLEQDALNAMQLAMDIGDEIDISLDSLPALVTAEQRVSYREDLRRRFDDFSLRRTLNNLLLGGEAVASSPAPSTAP